MGLEAEGAPDATDGGLTHAQLLGKAARTPMGGAFGSGLQSPFDHGFHLVIANLARSARPRLIAQRFHAACDEAVAPESDGERGGMQLFSTAVLVRPESQASTIWLRKRRDGFERGFRLSSCSCWRCSADTCSCNFNGRPFFSIKEPGLGSLRQQATSDSGD